MTAAEFNVLDFHEQIFFVLEANPIADRIESQSQVYLYYVDGFFVEIWCHLLQDEIIRFRAFKDSGFLEPYLEKVSIVDVVR